MSSEIQKLENDGLLITADNPEQIEEILSQLAGMKAAIRQAEVTIKQRMLDIILDTGRDITIGTVRYYAGHPVETKCLDIKGTLIALLEETGGDMERLAECLCSEPFKPATTLKMLPENAGKMLFKKKPKPKLLEGKPQKQLMEFDSRFVR